MSSSPPSSVPQQSPAHPTHSSDTASQATTQRQAPSFKPLQLSFPLPRSAVAGTDICVHLSILEHAVLVFLTTAGGVPSAGMGIETSGLQSTGEVMGSLDGGGGALGGGAPIDIVLPTVAGLGGKIESDILGMGPQNGGAGHAPAASPQAAPLGSFVHAIPDRYNPTTALSTALFIQEGSIDFTTRLARVLAKKMQLPVYVGNSISFAAAAGAGGSVEEEIEGFKRCVEIILREVRNKNVKSGRQEKKEERSEERSL